MRRHVVSFGLAFSGIWYALKTQPNFRFHLLASIVAIFAGISLKISHIEWVVIALTAVLVITSEMINTAIESMTNLITTEHRLSAKIAKDVSAGVVLVSAIGSLIVAAIIFLPKLFG